jgi:hypothetical protein
MQWKYSSNGPFPAKYWGVCALVFHDQREVPEAYLLVFAYHKLGMWLPKIGTLVLSHPR